MYRDALYIASKPGEDMAKKGASDATSRLAAGICVEHHGVGTPPDFVLTFVMDRGRATGFKVRKEDGEIVAVRIN
jgi:hypothetical protein